MQAAGWRNGTEVKSIKKGPGWFPAPTWWLSSVCNSRGLNTLFWLPQAPDMHAVHKHTCRQNAHTVIKLRKKIQD